MYISGHDPVQTGEGSMQQVKGLPVRQSDGLGKAPDIKHVAHFVEVDTVEDVAAVGAEDQSDAAVPIDEYGLAQPEVGGGKRGAPEGVS